MSRSAFSYQAKARDCSAIRLRMREITQARIHYGCERVLVMLRREGWRDNHKRVHRIYKEEGLSLRHCRPRRSRSSRRRQPIKSAAAPNALWGMDFVSDALAHKKFIGFTEEAVELLGLSGPDGAGAEGLVPLDKATDAARFLTLCRNLRCWTRA